MSSRDYKEQVIAAVPIESYVGRYVPLKRAGKRLTGLCPFHSEKTPSFSVTPEKGLFYCFGCGKGGDLLRFVMDYEGLSFPEALETLGRFAGIEKPKNFGGRKNDHREKLYDLNERVARSFAGFIQSPEGKYQFDYLRSRGLSAETIDSFSLGGAPESWEWLRSKYAEHEKDLVHLGLLKEGQQEGRPPYDFFRNRVMFPIRDGGGRYVAFGGRAMPGAEKQAKYINSPESSVFHKSQVLYGLYQGLGEIRSKGECFLVEGYMDVIGLYQAGYRTACAPLGTALTPDHLKLISRYTSNLTCIFDGDRAGRAAALKFARLSIEQGGLRSRVILLPAGQDPFDLALSLPAPVLEQMLGEEYRIPAERFYLLEVMFPGRFADDLAASASARADSADHAGSSNPDENVAGLEAAMQPHIAGADAPVAGRPENAVIAYTARARDYYTGQLPSALPRGTEKRPGLDRLFVELGEIHRDSDRLLLLEEAAHLLGLNANEVRREWQQSPQARAASRQRSAPPPRRSPGTSGGAPSTGIGPRFTSGTSGNSGKSSGPAPQTVAPDPGQHAPDLDGAPIANAPMDFGPDYDEAAGADVDGGGFEAGFSGGVSDGAPRADRRDRSDHSGGFERSGRAAGGGSAFVPQPNAHAGATDATARRRIACERALLIELFLAPALIGAYQAGIAGLEFIDPPAEFFWRYLETRYLTGNIWTVDDLSRFDLPEETLQVFSAQILQRLESEGRPYSAVEQGESVLSAVDEEEIKAAERLQVTVINDLLLELRILELKKKIADTSSRYVVADSVDQSYLIQESGRLVKELKELELQRRKSGQTVS
ncbi:MAG: DNA primase [bacterium]|nr:DNA primase [bacterium]